MLRAFIGSLPARDGTLYIHYVYTIYTLYIHYIYIIYTLYIHYIYTIYTLYIHYIYTIYAAKNTKVFCFLFDNNDNTVKGNYGW